MMGLIAIGVVGLWVCMWGLNEHTSIGPLISLALALWFFGWLYSMGGWPVLLAAAITYSPLLFAALDS